MADLGRKLMWAVVGGAAMKAARSATRGALHTRAGATKLPGHVKRQRNMQTALLLAVGTGALMAVADVMQEQGKAAARAAPPPGFKKK
jgi:hypothetical protein